MTEREALKLALNWFCCYLDKSMSRNNQETLAEEAITAIKEALAQPEPIKIAHKHEWFRTGEMKVGQMRCISCGTWGQEEMPQRTWVGLTDEEMQDLWDRYAHMEMMRAIEAKLNEKNT